MAQCTHLVDGLIITDKAGTTYTVDSCPWCEIDSLREQLAAQQAQIREYFRINPEGNDTPLWVSEHGALDSLLSAAERKERNEVRAAVRILCEATSWGAALGAIAEDEPELVDTVYQAIARAERKGAEGVVARVREAGDYKFDSVADWDIPELKRIAAWVCAGHGGFFNRNCDDCGNAYVAAYQLWRALPLPGDKPAHQSEERRKGERRGPERRDWINTKRSGHDRRRGA